MASQVKEYSKEKLTGQIFTPYFIVDKILDDTGYNSYEILGKSILDPACGDGRFLTKIAERIIMYSNKKDLQKNLSCIYGWDTDKDAVYEAINKLNHIILPYDISVNWNIKVLNSLHKAVHEKSSLFQKFDFIVGNPPYIRIQHLDINERNFIRNNYRFCKSGATDIYIAFYELALLLLKKTGKAAYITPNTFFHTETAKNLRKYFVNNQNLIQLTNFGHIQLFNDATTYSAITVFDKNKKQHFLFQSAINKNHFTERNINFDELKEQKFWQLSVKKPTNNKQGVKLGKIADIHVGITTLADKVYMLSYIKEDADADFLILNSKHKGKIKIEKAILKPIVKVSTLKNADETIKEYVLFPYKKIKGKYRIIPEKEISQKYPHAYKYLISVKEILDKRDNGKPNKVAWYAFGRTQGLNTSFGEKIVFSPMNKKPNFIYLKNNEASFYSGYCIKFKGNYKKLLNELNSERMEEFIKISARDFRGGWKAYNKKIVQEFIIYDMVHYKNRNTNY